MCFFIKSSTDSSNWIFDTKKEICLVGRSNVGKSSIINLLANKSIAKISNKPGSTKYINFYDFSKYRIVDLPGYGYSTLSKMQKKDIYDMIFEFVNNRKNLVAIIHVCNIDVFTEEDIQISIELRKKFKNYYLILNKADKQNKSFFHNNANKISQSFNLDLDNVLPLSCKNKMNYDKFSKLILSLSKK